MRFESHRFDTSQFVVHYSKYMRHNASCCYSMRHKGNSAGQAAFPAGQPEIIKNEAVNRAKIRQPYSALFWQYRERMEKEFITSGKNAKYVRARKSFERARNRSYL